MHCGGLQLDHLQARCGHRRYAPATGSSHPPLGLTISVWRTPAVDSAAAWKLFKARLCCSCSDLGIKGSLLIRTVCFSQVEPIAAHSLFACPCPSVQLIAVSDRLWGRAGAHGAFLAQIMQTGAQLQGMLVDQPQASWMLRISAALEPIDEVVPSWCLAEALSRVAEQGSAPMAGLHLSTPTCAASLASCAGCSSTEAGEAVTGH